MGGGKEEGEGNIPNSIAAAVNVVLGLFSFYKFLQFIFINPTLHAKGMRERTGRETGEGGGGGARETERLFSDRASQPVAAAFGFKHTNNTHNNSHNNDTTTTTTNNNNHNNSHYHYYRNDLSAAQYMTLRI